MSFEDLEHAATHAECSDVDVEQATSQPISFRQPRKRSSSQSLREIHVESTFPTQRDHRQGSWFFCGCKLRPRLHKSSFLLRAFALLVGTFIVFHAASCGYFFCMSFPGPHMLGFSRDLYIDMQSLANLGGRPYPDTDLERPQKPYFPQDTSPKLIPKIIHQTYRSANVPQAIRPLMQSWQTQNPDWSFRFYDDEACLDFVKREFPEYLSAYKGLAKNVERSDFFRYMVVLRLGGVYADVDTECKSPLNDIILPKDTLIVSWENEFSTAEEARQRKYVRKRQILQWTFAGAPGHPALREICDTIARTILDPIDEDTNLDTLERTGPGLWTDIILKHAHLHPIAKKTEDPFNVRIMPKVVFGAHPLGYDGLSGDDPGIIVLHHFLGSWKMRSMGLRKRTEAFLTWFDNLLNPNSEQQAKPPKPHREGYEHVLPRDKSTKQLYPVSLDFEPSFTMLVDLVGHGDPQSGSDVAATLTAYGTWQPALLPHRTPSVGTALIGSMGGVGGEKRTLVDIGAGIGLFSLMAAARGHQVIAFETAPHSIESFNASIHYNGFQDHIQIHQVPLGREEQEVCLDSNGMLSHEGRMEVAQFQRGYGDPEAHANLEACKRVTVRKRPRSLIPVDTQVGAIHISASGWEGWIWEGLQEVVATSKPDVIIVELHPTALAEVGYEGGAMKLLEGIYASGYNWMTHSGFACDERWMNITRSIRLKGGSQHENIKQPTWCQLEPEDFGRIVHRASTKYPENVMFARQTVQGASDAMQKAQREKEGHVIGSENEISHSEESITDEESWEESSSRAGGMQKHARSQKLRGSRKDQ